MSPFLYERPGWPNYTWDYESFAEDLALVRNKQGWLMGRMEGFGLTFQDESLLQTLTRDVVKSSEIEGELLNNEQVRSSIARRLGLETAAVLPPDRNVEGVVEMMLDATTNFQAPLTADRLFLWHAALFPTATSGMRRIKVGQWRDDALGPMQVVSGPLGRQRVHYQAPDAPTLDKEMEAFLNWFNRPADTDWVLKAALAHLWFLTLHPFEDGNGRIARAVADLALARSEQSSRRFYSMSAQVRLERKSYYEILEQTQRGTLNITGWLSWFLRCLRRAVEGAQNELSAALDKQRYWEALEDHALNDRQRKMLNRLLDGFTGKLTTSKWAALAKCSQDTALRDVLQLVEQGLLLRSPEGGRSTSYTLADPQQAESRPEFATRSTAFIPQMP